VKVAISSTTDAYTKVKYTTTMQAERETTLTRFKTISILVNGPKMSLMATANKSLPTVLIMKDSLLRESNRAMATMYVNLEFMRAILKTEISMARVLSTTQIIGFTKVSG
jgi:hypothetical protein